MIRVRNSKSREPALLIAGSMAVLTAPFAFLLYAVLEVNWTAVLCIFILHLGPLVTGFLIRRKVWSPASVQLIVNDVTEIQRKETFKKANTLRVWNQN